MRILIETNNPKVFTEYEGVAIKELFKVTIGNVGALSYDEESWLVSYQTPKHIVRLHLSDALKYSDIDANELATALDLGVDIDKMFQLSKVTTHIIEEKSNIPNILGKDFTVQDI